MCSRTSLGYNDHMCGNRTAYLIRLLTALVSVQPHTPVTKMRFNASVDNVAEQRLASLYQQMITEASSGDLPDGDSCKRNRDRKDISIAPSVPSLSIAGAISLMRHLRLSQKRDVDL